QNFMRAFQDKFPVSNHSPLSWFLGIKISQTQNSISISQVQFIKDLLREFGMENAKSVSTPAVPNSKLLPRQVSEAATNVKLYQRAVGKLLYLSNCTRPDIAHAVGELGRFMNNPSAEHWIAFKRVLRYLKGTSHYSLTYGMSEAEDENKDG